ncbi:MAG: LOG family protein [Firmicutes bacterium]|nr:LOG family protein [Bacillota bacterium]
MGHVNPDIDSMISGYLMEKLMKSKGYFASYIIPDRELDSQSYEICKKYGLDVKKYQKKLVSNASYILVDHHQRTIPGEIVGIIDHHPTKETFDIPYYWNSCICATALAIYEKEPSAFDAFDKKLIILASMIDTISFHVKEKVRSNDEGIIRKMCQDIHCDYQEMYQEGLCLTNMGDLFKASLHGLKKYQFANYTVASSYIIVKEDITKKLETILKHCKAYLEENQLHLFIFMHTDMKEMKTHIYFITRHVTKVVTKSGLVSRGSKIMPHVFQYYQTPLKLFIGCSSIDCDDSPFVEDTKYICEQLSHENIALYFGASSTGLMGICYEAFRNVGVHSYTIQKYVNDLKQIKSISEKRLETTMERTKALYYDSEVLLFLPGGSGTASELFAMIEENRSVETKKPLLIYNQNHHYQFLIDWIQEMIQKGMNDESIYQYFKLCNTKEEVVREIVEISLNNILEFE